MPDRIITARVQRIERMASSRNGNPRFRITLDNGENYPTQPDAAFGYAAENPEIIGTWQQRENGAQPLVDFTVNGRDHITYGKPHPADFAAVVADTWNANQRIGHVGQPETPADVAISVDSIINNGIEDTGNGALVDLSHEQLVALINRIHNYVSEVK